MKKVFTMFLAIFCTFSLMSLSLVANAQQDIIDENQIEIRTGSMIANNSDMPDENNVKNNVKNNIKSNGSAIGAKTGDNYNIMLLSMIIISLSGAVLVVILLKRSGKKES